MLCIPVVVLFCITSCVCYKKASECTYNPLFLEGTCSAHYTDPAALLIDNLFLSLAEADCELANPCDYPPHYSPRDWEEFDFIIIGAGAAGSVVANRLTEVAGWTVLLLEAGGDPPKTSEVPTFTDLLLNTEVDWQFKTDPEEYNCLGMEGNRCNWHRAKMLGGCSSHNNVAYIRGNRKDYDRWESDGNVGWSYKHVLPYFKKSEDMRSSIVRSTPDFHYFHGVGGPLKVEDSNITYFEPLAATLAEGFAEIGYRINPDSCGKYQTGFCRQGLTTQDGRRCSTAKAFLSPIISRGNLKISKYSLVTKVLIDERSNLAYGVEFIDRTGKTVRVLTRKEIILSTSTINSPQVLMLSGIGPSYHLNSLGITVTADLPVGNNLQDHPIAFGLIVALDYFTPQIDDKENMFNFLLNYNNTFSSIGIGSFLAFIHSENKQIDYPDIEVYMLYYPTNSSALSLYMGLLGFRADIKQQFTNINSHSPVILFLPVILNPKSRGRIRLQSKSPLQKPKITSGYLSDPQDVKTFKKAFNLLRDVAQSKPMRALGAKLYEVEIESCSRYPFGSIPYRDCFLRHLATSGDHFAGTCRMGPPGHPDAVVDPQLRVQGVGGLRVIDASVMPRIVRGNLNAPTIMIAEKGSDLIKKTWLSTPYTVPLRDLKVC